MLPDYAVNFLAGGTQATLVTITGYPFDIVKSRMQTGKYRNSLSCLQTMVLKEGPLSLYRGASAPWISHMMKRPIQYPMAERMKEILAERHIGSNYIIGGATGMVGPVFGTPLQVVKVGMQTSTGFTTPQYIGHVYKTNGFTGFYRGLVPTMFKDTLFGASFLGHYYSLRDYFKSNPVQNVPEWTVTFFSGSMAHCATWLILIPIDTVKTKVQKANEQRGVTKIIVETFRQDGLRAFWRGVVPACLRTIPVSGVAMVGYEYVRRLF